MGELEEGSQHAVQAAKDEYMGGCQNYVPFLGTLNIGIMGTILGLYEDNGKQNGNYGIGVIYTLVIPFCVP